MSNTNRDYLIICDVKNSKITISRPMNFYVTDKNTSNIFIRLVTQITTDDGIKQYVDIEDAAYYTVTLRVIKPNDEIKSVVASELTDGAIYQIDLPEDYKDMAGVYKCELLIGTSVNGIQELNTSDPFTYTVKRSIYGDIGDVTYPEDTIIEAILNRLDTIEARSTIIPIAGDISITDMSDYFTSTNVEDSLQEVGSQIEKMTHCVTPEMFGAKGDGVTDDTDSIKKALKNGKKINLTNNKIYLISEYITIDSNTEITGNGELYFKNSSISSRFNPSLIDVYNANNVKIKGIKITADCDKTSSLVRIANCSDIEIVDNDITFKREDGVLNLVIDVHNNNENVIIHNNNIKHLTINTEYGGIINVNNNDDAGNETGSFITENIVIKNNSFYSSSGDEMVCVMNMVDGSKVRDVTILNNIFKRPIETIKTHMLAISSKYDGCVENVMVLGNTFVSEAQNATSQKCAIRLGAEGEGIGKIKNIMIQNNSISGYLDMGVWCVLDVPGEIFISNNSFSSIENNTYAINNNIMDIVAVGNYAINFTSVYNVLNTHIVGENFLNNKMSGRYYVINRNTWADGNVSINLETYSTKYSIKFYGVFNNTSVSGVITVLSSTSARGLIVKPTGVEDITCTLDGNTLLMEVPAYSSLTFESTNYID
ncbi:MAG: hypothetical protein ACI3T9_01440 [Romboutsia timonensis]